MKHIAETFQKTCYDKIWQNSNVEFAMIALKVKRASPCKFFLVYNWYWSRLRKEQAVVTNTSYTKWFQKFSMDFERWIPVVKEYQWIAMNQTVVKGSHYLSNNSILIIQKKEKLKAKINTNILCSESCSSCNCCWVNETSKPCLGILKSSRRSWGNAHIWAPFSTNY